MSEELPEVLASFKAKHAALFASPSYSLGFGLDPEKKGPQGFILYAMSNDLAEQAKLILTAKKIFAKNDTEAHPVYFKGIPAMKF